MSQAGGGDQQATISNAQARWELENEVQNLAGPADLDALYRYDAEEQKALLASKPWTRDPHYFKRCDGEARKKQSRAVGSPDHKPQRDGATAGHGRERASRAASATNLLKQPAVLCWVRISALALLKMAMHAKSGGNIEVMGVMQAGVALLLGRCVV